MRMRMRMTIIIKIFFSEQNKRMSYYLFNRHKIVEKAKERYSKEKAAKYYLQNKEVIKEKARNCYKNLSEEAKKHNQRVSKEKVLRID